MNVCCFVRFSIIKCIQKCCLVTFLLKIINLVLRNLLVLLDVGFRQLLREAYGFANAKIRVINADISLENY